VRQDASGTGATDEQRPAALHRFRACFSGAQTLAILVLMRAACDVPDRRRPGPAHGAGLYTLSVVPLVASGLEVAEVNAS
jgi:hypothetical protein